MVDFCLPSWTCERVGNFPKKTAQFSLMRLFVFVSFVQKDKHAESSEKENLQTEEGEYKR